MENKGILVIDARTCMYIHVGPYIIANRNTPIYGESWVDWSLKNKQVDPHTHNYNHVTILKQ